MKPEFVGLGLILAGALYLFWTQRVRTDITALLVMLCLAIPWPHPHGQWAGILTPQEAFAGFGSVVVIMVTAMFVFSAALVRTGAAEMIGGRLFRASARNELLFQAAVFTLATACSTFINALIVQGAVPTIGAC
jgi:di/tricarboxylate transporter